MKENTFRTKRFSFAEQHLVTAVALGARRAFVVGPGADASPRLLSKAAAEELPQDFPLLPFRETQAFFEALEGPEFLVVILPALAFRFSEGEFEDFLLRLAPLCKEGSSLIFSYPGGPLIPEGFPRFYSYDQMETLLSRCGFRIYDHVGGEKDTSPVLCGRVHDLPYCYCLAVRKPARPL